MRISYLLHDLELRARATLEKAIVGGSARGCVGDRAPLAVAADDDNGRNHDSAMRTAWVSPATGASNTLPVTRMTPCASSSRRIHAML